MLHALGADWGLGPLTADSFDTLPDGSLLYADGIIHPVHLRVRCQDEDVIHANDGDVGPMDYRVEPLQASP